MADIANNNALAALPKSIKTNDPYISSARIGQKNATTTRIVFDLKQTATPHFTAHAPSGSLKHRLQIDLGNEAAASKPAPAKHPQPQAPAPQPASHAAPPAAYPPPPPRTAGALLKKRRPFLSQALSNPTVRYKLLRYAQV